MPGFVHRERVRFGDLDAMLHVNNAVFLRYFESARISYLGELQVHDPVAEVEAGFGLIFAARPSGWTLRCGWASDNALRAMT
jgi:acyl-CoA thioesterase FadM